MNTLWKKSFAWLLAGLLIAVLPFAAEAGKKDKKKEEAEEEKWDVSNPPGKWETIVIDTTETTWSDVDVSPDGSTLVFDMLGDIYSVPIEGGEAQALTDGSSGTSSRGSAPTVRRSPSSATGVAETTCGS